MYGRHGSQIKIEHLAPVPQPAAKCARIELRQPAERYVERNNLPDIAGISRAFTRSVAICDRADRGLCGIDSQHPQAFSGYVSDRFGTRKLPVFLGYSLAAITRPFLAFISSWPQVLVVRMTDRVGKGIRGAPRDALIADSVPYKERGFAFGFNRAADNLGAVFGPIAAFALLSIFAANTQNPTLKEYQQVFLFASVPVVFGRRVIVFFVKDDKKTHTENEIKAPPKFTLRGFDGNFKRFLVVIALFTLSNSTDAFLLLRAGQAGITPVIIPLLWMTLSVSKVVFSLIGGDPIRPSGTKGADRRRLADICRCLRRICLCVGAVACVGTFHHIRIVFRPDRRRGKGIRCRYGP